MVIESPSGISPVAEPLRGPLQHAVEEATRLLRADGAMIYLVDVEAGVLRCATDAGITDPQAAMQIRELELPLGKGMFGSAVVRGRVVSTGDYPSDRSFPHARGADLIARAARMRAMAVAPLVADGEVLGALGAYVQRPVPFDEAQIGLLKALAEHAAVALANQRLMQQLAASEERYRYLVEHSPDVVWSTDRGGSFTYLSETCRQLTGWEAAELIGQHWSIIVVPEDRDGFQAAWRHAQDNGGAEQRHRYRLLHRDGHYIPVELRGREAMSGAGIGAHGSIRDITELDRLEHDLRRQTDELAHQVEARRSLAEIAQQLTTMRGADAILQRTVDEAARLLGAEAARIDLTERDSALLHWRFSSTGSKLPSGSGDDIVNVDEGVSGRAVREGRVVWTGRYLDDRSFRHGAAADAYVVRHAVQSVMAAPLLGEADLLGTLTISSLRRDAFDAADASLLGALATQAAIAVSNARLYADLRDSERRYRHLVDNSPDIVWSIDDEGRLIFLSDSLERRTGWKPDDLLGKPFTVLTDDATRGPTQAAFAALRARPDEEQRLRTSLPLANGQQAPVEITMMGSLANGRFNGAHGSVRDITEQERLEASLRAQTAQLAHQLESQQRLLEVNQHLYEELQESERRYRYLVDNSPDMIWAVDEDGAFTFVSDSVRHLAGYEPEDVLGSHWERLAAPESIPIAQERWERMRTAPDVEQQMRIELLRSDGSRLPVEINMMASVADGRFTGAHGAVRDVGARERLERDLRRQAAELAASGERANLARELHDSVTQALFSMGLTARSLELLLDSDPAGARKKLADLRDLQRDALAEMRTLIFELRPASLEQDGLTQAIRTHAAAVEGRTGLAVEVSCPADDYERPPLDVEEALYRIAQEALHNVVKHANARSVRIDLTRTRDQVGLTVEDDGTGFEPGRIPRGHLGLDGMRQRADGVNGRLKVSSTLGKGTTVRAEVDLASAGSAK